MCPLPLLGAIIFGLAGGAVARTRNQCQHIHILRCIYVQVCGDHLCIFYLILDLGLFLLGKSYAHESRLDGGHVMDDVRGVRSAMA
jgi:hypothetical protein